MEPVDKFGRGIFGVAWFRLCENGRMLKNAGYSETKKPNLFIRYDSGFRLYADMRGTDVIPIWDDTRPLFYLFPSNNEEADQSIKKRNSIMASEIARLQREGVEVRLSFYEEAEPGSDSFGSYFQCVNCNRAFGFPSAEAYCQECIAQHNVIEKRNAAVELNRAEKCPLCGLRVLPRGKTYEIKEKLGDGLEIRESAVHHTHYIPERTIVVCRQCHSKIHHSNDPFYQQFKAEMSRREFERKMKQGSEERRDVKFRNWMKQVSGPARKGKRVVKRREAYRPYANLNLGVSYDDIQMTCSRCGYVFPSAQRTTCPNCREFFR